MLSGADTCFESMQARKYSLKSLLIAWCAFFILDLCDTVVPGSSMPHLKHGKHSRWFCCVTKCDIIIPHLAGGRRVQMPSWMIIAILKVWWQVSTHERLCFVELVTPACSQNRRHIITAWTVWWSYHPGVIHWPLVAICRLCFNSVMYDIEYSSKLSKLSR